MPELEYRLIVAGYMDSRASLVSPDVGAGMLSEYTAGSLLDACGVQPSPTRYPCAAGIRSNLRSNLC